LEKIEMKKTLVAVAAMAAVTGAMADVTIFGIVDQAYTITSSTAATASGGAKTKLTSIAGQYTGNELGFKGNEDLGGGLKADFQIHFAPNVDGTPAVAGVASSTYATAYQSHVGLSGGFGYVRLGQFFSPSFFNNATYDSVGYSGVANASNINSGAGLKSNAVEYTLPVLMEGVAVSYMMAKGEVAAPSTSASNDFSNIRVSYTSGPLSVGYATDSTKGVPGSTTKGTSTGFSYNFGMAKVYYSGLTQKVTGVTYTVKGSSMGVSVPFGATTLGLQSSNSSNLAASGDKSTGSLIQVKHDLSKRTSVIFQNGTEKNTAGTSLGAKTTTSAIGLWHSF